MRRLLALVLAIGGLVVPWPSIPPAQAQDGGTEAPGEAERTALARDQFREGVHHAQRSDWQRAAEHFGRALDLRPSPQIRYNLAESLFNLGRLVEASEHVALLEGERTLPGSVRLNTTSLRGRIDERIGSLLIRVEGAPPDASVSLDGRELPAPSLGAPMAVDPGTHFVRIEVRGETIATREVVVAPGASEGVTLSGATVPTPRETAAAAQSGEPAERGAAPDAGGAGWWPWVAGAVLVGAAAVLAVILLSGDADPTQGNFTPGVIEVR